MRLAVGIFGFHQPATLKATVESVRKIAQTVYLLDTGSDDEISELALSLGVTVIEHTWQNDAALARNEIIERVEADNQHDWLLWMESGEVFHPDYLHAFRFFCESEIQSGHVFMLTSVRYPLQGDETLTQLITDKRIHRNTDRDEEEAEIRLIPLNYQLRYVGKFRETLVCNDPEAVINVSGMPGLIVSLMPYYQSEEAREFRVRRNIEILRESRAAAETIENELLVLHAETMFEMGDYNLARDSYRQLIATSNKNNLLLEAYYRAAELFDLTSMPSEETVAFLLAGLDTFPLDQQLLTLLGLHLQRQKNFPMAIRALEAAVQYGKVAFDVFHRRHIAEQATIALSIAHQLSGDSAAAMRVVEERLDSVAYREPLAERLFDLYFVDNRLQEAVQLASTIWKGRELALMRDVITGACRASSGAWEAAIIPLENAYVSGSRHPLCLRWYSLALLALKRFDAAQPILAEWVQIEPDNIGARAFLFAASDPTTFAESLKQIQKSQMNFLGIESPATITPSNSTGFSNLLDDILSSGSIERFRDEMEEVAEATHKGTTPAHHNTPAHHTALQDFVESSSGGASDPLLAEVCDDILQETLR